MYLYLYPVFDETEDHATVKAGCSGGEDEIEGLPPVSWLNSKINQASNKPSTSTSQSKSRN